MAVTAITSIDSNNRRRGCLVPMLEAGALGSAAGYALKYTYPVTPQEKTTPEYQRAMREIQEKSKLFGPESEAYLDKFRAKNNLSPAQDTFVKMYEGKKEGDSVGFSFYKKLRDAHQSLHEKDPVSAQEFRRLLHDAREASDKTVKRSVDAYNIATKSIRPTAFFVISGAVVGAIIALAHSVLRTEVKH